MSVIVQPTFRTGPSDDLATQDVYKGVAGNETINRFKSIVTEYSKDAVAPITGNGRQTAKEVTPAIVGIARERGKMSNAQILSRVGMASPSIGKAFNGVNSGLQKAIMSGMQTDKLPKSVQVALNGRISDVDFRNVKSLDGIGQLMKDITGQTALQTKDPRAISAFLSSTIGIGMDMGVDGLTKDILETINDPAIKNGIAEQLGKKATNRSNTMDLYYLASHAQPGVIQYNNPDLINQYCRKYSRAKKLTYAQYVEEYNFLIGAFDKIDPSWDIYNRATSAGIERCIDITPLICNNSDLADLFNVVISPLDDCEEKAYLLAELHTKTTVESSLKAEFPSIAFGFGKTTQAFTSALDL